MKNFLLIFSFCFLSFFSAGSVDAQPVAWDVAVNESIQLARSNISTAENAYVYSAGQLFSLIAFPLGHSTSSWRGWTFLSSWSIDSNLASSLPVGYLYDVNNQLYKMDDNVQYKIDYLVISDSDGDGIVNFEDLTPWGETVHTSSLDSIFYAVDYSSMNASVLSILVILITVTLCFAVYFKVKKGVEL